MMDQAAAAGGHRHRERCIVSLGERKPMKITPAEAIVSGPGRYFVTLRITVDQGRAGEQSWSDGKCLNFAPRLFEAECARSGFESRPLLDVTHRLAPIDAIRTTVSRAGGSMPSTSGCPNSASGRTWGATRRECRSSVAAGRSGTDSRLRATHPGRVSTSTGRWRAGAPANRPGGRHAVELARTPSVRRPWQARPPQPAVAAAAEEHHRQVGAGGNVMCKASAGDLHVPPAALGGRSGISCTFHESITDNCVQTEATHD